jgi:hypothetical protein
MSSDVVLSPSRAAARTPTGRPLPCGSAVAVHRSSELQQRSGDYGVGHRGAIAQRKTGYIVSTQALTIYIWSHHPMFVTPLHGPPCLSLLRNNTPSCLDIWTSRLYRGAGPCPWQNTADLVRDSLVDPLRHRATILILAGLL